MAKIIAEFCQNHNGDLAVLKDMVWAAAEAGADIAKIQSIRSNELTNRPRFEQGVVEKGVQLAIKRPYQPEFERLRTLDLSEDQQRWFVEECARAEIEPMTTVFSRAAIPFASSCGWRSVKVASYDCASYPMLAELRGRFDHLYVSTGATHDHEIEGACDVLTDTAFTLLHCVTIYPTPFEEMHLNRMSYLRRLTPLVGFSDHSLVERDGIKAAVVAISKGADVVERHFTVLPSGETKDGPVSINPAQLEQLARVAHAPVQEVADMVRDEIPEADSMMGMERRELSPGELLNRDYYRGRFASRVGDSWVYNWEGDALS